MSKINEDFPGSKELFTAGYTTEAKIDAATDEELLAVEGIGPATLGKIRAALSTTKQVEPVEVAESESPTESHQCANPRCGHIISVSPCSYCGY